MNSLSLKIDGMNCASCANNIEKEISKISGVSQARVNFATSTGFFEFEQEPSRIKDAIISLGYKVSSPGEEIDKDVLKSSWQQFLISIVLSIFIFTLAMWPLQGWPSPSINGYLQLLFCIPIWIWVGLDFQKALVIFFKTGRSNMNTLIGLGTTAAFLYSVFIVLFNQTSQDLGLTQRLYFEAVGFIISFVYLGKFLEEKAKKKTTEALKSLFQMSSKKALVISSGEECEVHIQEVSEGDVLRVKPGEIFPVDGEIVRGVSVVNESMISGESIPVAKNLGDTVFAGTVNGRQVIDYRATKVGASTFLGQMIQFVEQAQGAKTEIQKYADKISSVFVPVVILIALLTLVLWWFVGGQGGDAVSNFIAVLVIACPCALGLATPTAVAVSTGRASLKGLLISGGDIIEKIVKVNTVVFDKTGTLTEGQPSVVQALFEEESQEVLADIASIEKFSEHPLSQAVIQYAKTKNINLSEPDQFEIIEGLGVSARISGHNYLIGSSSLMKAHRISLSGNLLSNKVGTEIYVARDGEHVALFKVTDKVKKSSRQAVQRLKDLGLETWMLTGDRSPVAGEIAQEVGLDHFIAEVLPLQKAEQIQKIQSQGKSVIMVGDGVNDAPALSLADISIAMGTGSGVAIDTSDVTIVNGDLSQISDLVHLSKGTMKIIKQNLFLSMVYNVLLIPVAAGVLTLFGGPMIPPVLASAAMALSSVSVVSNSLRIRKLI